MGGWVCVPNSSLTPGPVKMTFKQPWAYRNKKKERGHYSKQGLEGGALSILGAGPKANSRENQEVTWFPLRRTHKGSGTGGDKSNWKMSTYRASGLRRETKLRYWVPYIREGTSHQMTWGPRSFPLLSRTLASRKLLSGRRPKSLL
jgi:hypothetical protein